ncbi:MAG: hypothetical protein Q7R41_08950 [Phycisphaerales bacterium]|nr:hypothetical protein [Phycisphaerales bacterium]
MTVPIWRVAVAWAIPLVMTGCGMIFGLPFTAGSYVADVPCTIRVADATGTTVGEDEFSAPTTLTIDADGALSVNGVELVVGRQVVRSIPTADLAFEITKVTRRCRTLTVEYIPRPTLVGILVEGRLVETYRWRNDSIRASAEADLVVTDVSGETTFTVNCAGVLSAG